MKTTKLVAPLLFLAMLSIQTETFCQTMDKPVYEFAIVQRYASFIHVFYSSGTSDKTKIPKDLKNEIAVASKLEELSAEGWEVALSQSNGTIQGSILMKREKE